MHPIAQHLPVHAVLFRNLRARIAIKNQRALVLKVLWKKGQLNVKDIARILRRPQSATATDVRILEPAGLVRAEVRNSTMGPQNGASPATTRW